MLNIDYATVSGMCLNNLDQLKELEDDIYEHINRGIMHFNSLSSSDQEYLIGQLIECLNDEGKLYFITESRNAIDSVNIMAKSMQHKSSWLLYAKEISSLAQNYYADYIDAIFEEIITRLNAENNNNSNHISEGY